MKKFRPFFTGLFLAVLMSIPGMTLTGQILKPGPQDLSFFSTVDEADQPYAVYIPKNYCESKKYPLVIFLHGAWSNHRLGLRRAFGQGNTQGVDFIKPGNVPVETDLESTRYFPKLKDVEYIVAAPLARGTAGYQGIPEQDVYDMLADLKSRFSIDDNRIYLTGLSMGGGGTIWLGLTRPDIWAAIAPCCPAPPDGSADLAPNSLNLPVHLFIGDKDFLYKTAIEWKARFETCTPVFEYIEYPGIGHNSWEYAYKDGFIFDWFSQFVRDPFPQQVRFNTRWYKYDEAYWVKFDEITPGTLATIDARFTSVNNIEVTTSGLDGFTLKLEGHPMFIPAQKLNVKIDGKSFALKTSDAAAFMKSGGSWTNKKYTPGLTSKQNGAEGPLSAAVSSNHVYVYGTGGNPSREELAQRREQAALAADWSGMGGRIMVFPRVISDKEVRQSDYDNSNLILFGTMETNSIIEKLADKLPAQMNTEAKDYGFVYIFPVNKHYVMVNSGLVWWTPEKKQAQGGMAFMGSKIEILRKYQDFVLFRESPDNIISQGSFTNDWKFPDDAAAKLKSTGVITIRQ